MASSDAVAAGEKPLWRKIVDFPLVTMGIAGALFIAALTIGFFLVKFVPPIGKVEKAALSGAINIALVLAAYKLVIVKLGADPRDDLPTRGALKNLSLGLLAGFVIFSAVVGVAAIADVYNIVGPGNANQFALELIGTAILPGFMEELFFRGILFRWLEQFGGSWLALALTSALFGAAHLANPNASLIAAFGIAIEAGVLLGGAYMVTRSLWLPMGLHAAWNFTQGEIFDIPVSGLDEHGLVQAQLSGPPLLSGGGFGLEASLFAMVLATAAGVWLVYLAVRRGALVQPMWVRRRRALAAPATA